jgi:predicted DNA binding protein
MNDRAQGRFTVYGDTVEDIESIIDTARASELTDSVRELHEGFRLNGILPSGTPTRELFVEYKSSNSIDSVLASEGFVRDAPNRIANGRETWSVVLNASRTEMRERLDQIRDRMDADIDTDNEGAAESLSDRQREIFEYARSQGYYAWPREVSVTELADGLDITKTTVLEHLRKAEAKMLGAH